MDTGPSGSGVFYQVTPAVGDDGKNIMKLVPVQMFNQSQITKVDCEALCPNIPQSAVHMFSPSAHLTTTTPTHLFINVSSNQTPANRKWAHFPSKNPPQHQTVNPMTKVPQMFIRRRSVTVRSTAPSPGKSVPRKNSTPTTHSSSVYMSAMATLGSHIPDLFPKSNLYPNHVSAAENEATCEPILPKRSKSHLKLIPKVSQRPNSPIKWVIEDENSSNPKPTGLASLHLPSVTSEILQTVAKRENKKMQQHSKTITKHATVCQTFTAKGQHAPDNNVLIFNGKVFVIVKKRNLPFQMREEASVSPPKCSESTKVDQTSGDGPMKQSLGVPRDLNHIIDLCDDDPQTADTTPPDEDHVIFVSYIPPKPKSGSNPAWADTPSEKETTHIDLTSEENSLAPHRKLRVDAGPSSTDDHVPSAVSGSAVGWSAVSGSAVSGTSDLSSHRDCEHSSKSTQTLENSPHELQPCVVSEGVLRKTFGLTADVKVCLHRTHVTSPSARVRNTCGLKRTHLDMEPEPLHYNTRLTKGQSSYRQTLEPGMCYMEPLDEDLPSTEPLDEDLPSAEPLDEDLPSTEPLDEDLPSTEPLDEDLPSTEPLDESLPSTEPLDEDLPSTEPLDESLLSTDNKDLQQNQTFSHINTKVSRVGRTRKRTTCPCCPSTGLDLH